jgi:hypothetical protein
VVAATCCVSVAACLALAASAGVPALLVLVLVLVLALVVLIQVTSFADIGALAAGAARRSRSTRSRGWSRASSARSWWGWSCIDSAGWGRRWGGRRRSW